MSGTHFARSVLRLVMLARAGAAALVLGGTVIGLSACANPDETVTVGYADYRTLPPGNQPSRPSSGTSNGAGCVPPPGQSARC
jgi:hypothetical protein